MTLLSPRSIGSALCLMAVLLVLPAGPTPARSAPALPDPDAILAGRNCGGTSKPVGLSRLAADPLGGQGWSLGGPLDAPPVAANQLGPGIAVGPTGQVVYVWQEAPNDDAGNIYAASLTGGPSAGRRAVRVDDTGAARSEQAAPTVAIDSSGAIHAVWEDLRGGALRRLYYAGSANGGTTWSANVLLTGALPALNHASPHLVAGPGGTLYLAWDGGNTIYFSHRVGGAWSAPAPIHGGPAHDRDLPRLAFDSQGRLLAAWEDRGGAAPVINVARLDQPTSGAWGTAVRASPAGASAAQPSLATSDDGSLYLAYNGAPGIFLVASGDGGASWGPARRVDDGDGNAFTNPRVAVGDDGTVHCVWCRLRVNVVADVLTARSSDGGASWDGRVTLASTTGTAEPLELIAAGDRLYAAWSDDGTGRPTLHTALWSPGTRTFIPLLQR